MVRNEFLIPYSLFLIPYSLFLIPYSLFFILYSLFFILYSLFFILYSLFKINRFLIDKLLYSVCGEFTAIAGNLGAAKR
ncbi:hypothetical protein CJ305_05730 [Leeuwenhoekiella nanhaiensis]|uniref:Uncharacterized protein n=1 Tax=Leeuwenhoekiella nanhaiensis TaxID=1655491 RepID=A0A2G1VV36_9FLAO|nr:hypothetical protein CJ305_05730 [Leeuwenhoekiella nanhaiensis]